MLHEGRIEIEGKGTFEVCFRSEGSEPWTTGRIGFYEAEETIMFLVDSMFLPPQEAGKAVLEAIVGCRSVVEKVVCSDQQLQSIFGPRLYVASARRAS
jgi:hypothetical protein